MKVQPIVSWYHSLSSLTAPALVLSARASSMVRGSQTWDTSAHVHVAPGGAGIGSELWR